MGLGEVLHGAEDHPNGEENYTCHCHELIPPQNCANAAPRAKRVLQLAASAQRMVMRLAVFLIPGLALAGLALAVRRHRLAAR